MKKWLKRIALAIAALVLVVILVATWFVVTFEPKSRPASTERVEATPERLARGRYLAEGVLSCTSCHSERDWKFYGRPVIGPHGAGGECFAEEAGFDGNVCSANITPDKETGIGDWTDGEILRAFREGIGRDGKALAPVCPYEDSRSLSDEDAKSVVVYLRSLKPVRHQVAEKRVSFPTSFFIKMVPRPLSAPVPSPDPADSVAYGKYLSTVGHCRFCHTQVDERFQPLPGMTFAGGMEHHGPWGTVRSTNLTPHQTGIGHWKKENFIGIFRAFSTLTPADAAHNTPMPWPSLATMTDADLGAIYDYLRTLPPVDNPVTARPDAVRAAREAAGL